MRLGLRGLLAGGVVAVTTGCSGNAAPNNPDSSTSAGMTTAGGGAGGAHGGSVAAPAGNGGAPGSNGGAPGSNGGAPGSSGGGSGGMTVSAGPMKLLSQGLPAFASSGSAERANDDKPNIAWSSESLPAWLAYDMSGVPAAERKQVLLAWYCYFADYLITDPKPEQQLPIDYVVEINQAPGGRAPSDGWIEVAKVTANSRSARQHLFDARGANWIRLRVSKSSEAGKVMLDLDVYSAPAGGSDSWLFMGDSITYMTTHRAFSDLPALVAKRAPGRVPLVIDGALGGTNTTTAQEIIDTSLAQFDGRYVVLAYGTNDHANEYQMDTLVQKVIASGKVPVVPHVPWSDQKLEEGPLLNEQVDALYARYPEILRGPDLWAAFQNKLDLIPRGDVHPNAAGMEFLREQWATVMATTAP